MLDFSFERYSLDGAIQQITVIMFLFWQTFFELLPKKCFDPNPLQGVLAQKENHT